MKIAALQMVSSTDVAKNCDDARTLIHHAAREGAQLVCLPEYFCQMGRSDRDKLAIAEAPGVGPIQDMLSQAAREERVWLVGGTLPLRTAHDQRVTNTNLVFDPQGIPCARYDKRHLFRFDNGRERYDEGALIQAGDRVVAVQAGPLRVGLSVCYDLRFPEHYRELMRTACDVMCVPSAFTYTTGLAHWELLLRARAVENQCYVLAAAQGGHHENGRRTFGHSLVIDPWGEILALRPEGAGVVVADVDPARLMAVRRQLPALEHRQS